MTFAPREAATSLVRSVELLSTTITSSTNSGMLFSTRRIPSSSFRQGIITVIDWPLYMLYHDNHESCRMAMDMFATRGTEPAGLWRARSVYAADGQRPGPLHRQSPNQQRRVPSGDGSEEGRRRIHRSARRTLRKPDERAVSGT